MNSPFKFLDAYDARDKDIFFGREEEIDQLYKLVFQSRLLLVYGQSGTGKTSLVQCGLTKKFSPTNWLPLTVRRGDDIGAALGQTLSAAAITPIAPGTPVVDAIRSVFLDHLRPVFLIFDQFEELYVLGSKAEQEAFYAAIKQVLEADVSCRIIVLLREEYLAALDPFERAVPALFDKRLRVEVMTNSNVEKVILGTCAAHGIALEHGADTARLIIDQLDDKRVGVQLAYLQVYLDHLYRVAAKGSGPITFTDAAIAEAGKLGDVMAGFLDEQERAIETALGAQVPPGGIARLLEEFVSADGTKQPSTYDQVLARIPSARPWLQGAIELLQSSRLLRSVDGHYELAHDALAGRIAERRSGERKQLLMVEKLVQNRVAEFDQTKTLLNAEELALVGQTSKLVDPLDGSPLLKLDPAASDFVKRSRSSNLRKRFGRIGVLFVALLVPALLLLWNLAQSQSSDDSKAYASNVADLIGFGALINTGEASDQQVRDQVRWTHGMVRASNIDIDLGDKVNEPGFKDSDGDLSFWGRLYDADDLFFAKQQAKGLASLRELEVEQRTEHAADPADVITTGKLKSVLWHHFFLIPEPDKQVAEELYAVMDEEVSGIVYDPIGFKDDLIDLCRQPKALKVLGKEKCDKYPDTGPDNEPASAAPTAAVAATDADSSDGQPPKIGY